MRRIMLGPKFLALFDNPKAKFYPTYHKLATYRETWQSGMARLLQTYMRDLCNMRGLA